MAEHRPFVMEDGPVVREMPPPCSGIYVPVLGTEDDKCCAKSWVQARKCVGEEELGEYIDEWWELTKEIIDDECFVRIVTQEGNVALPFFYINDDDPEDPPIVRVVTLDGSPEIACDKEPVENYTVMESCGVSCPNCPDDTPQAFDVAFDGLTIYSDANESATGFFFVAGVFIDEIFTIGSLGDLGEHLEDYEPCVCMSGYCIWSHREEREDLVDQIIGLSGDVLQVFITTVVQRTMTGYHVSCELTVFYDGFYNPFSITLFSGETPFVDCNEGPYVVDNEAVLDQFGSAGDLGFTAGASGTATITPRGFCTFEPIYVVTVTGTIPNCNSSFIKGDDTLDGVYPDIPINTIVTIPPPGIDPMQQYGDAACTTGATPSSTAPDEATITIGDITQGGSAVSVRMEQGYSGAMLRTWYGEVTLDEFDLDVCGYPRHVVIPFAAASGQTNFDDLPYTAGFVTLELQNAP